MIERTLSIIKPDAVSQQVIGKILALFEEAGLTILATKMVWMSRAQASEFYAVHQEKPFFNDLVNFMISGPVVVSVLQGENAVQHYREVIGATDPAKAAAGTVRQLYGKSVQNNAVHGSDSKENALIEIRHFFGAIEIFERPKKLKT